MEAIILAGGLGTRLRSRISDRPKVMAPIGDTPFLTYLMKLLQEHHAQRVVLATGYLHEVIEGYYGRKFEGMDLEYAIEREPLGTGGAIKHALAKTQASNVIIMNGDTFFQLDLSDFLQQHKREQAELTIALKPMQDFSRYGAVRIDGTRIVGFDEKKQVDSGYINAGVYAVPANLFESCEMPKKFSFETDFLQKRVSELKIHAYLSDSYFIDIGIPTDYERAQRELNKV